LRWRKREDQGRRQGEKGQRGEKLEERKEGRNEGRREDLRITGWSYLLYQSQGAPRGRTEGPAQRRFPPSSLPPTHHLPPSSLPKALQRKEGSQRRKEDRGRRQGLLSSRKSPPRT
jgi:hypothetical protein